MHKYLYQLLSLVLISLALNACGINPKKATRTLPGKWNFDFEETANYDLCSEERAKDDVERMQARNKKMHLTLNADGTLEGFRVRENGAEEIDKGTWKVERGIPKRDMLEDWKKYPELSKLLKDEEKIVLLVIEFNGREERGLLMEANRDQFVVFGDFCPRVFTRI